MFRRLRDPNCEDATGCAPTRRLFQFRRRGPALQYWFPVRSQHSVPLAQGLPVTTDHEQEVRLQAGRFRPAGRTHLSKNVSLSSPSNLHNAPSVFANSWDPDSALV